LSTAVTGLSSSLMFKVCRAYFVPLRIRHQASNYLFAALRAISL
jgi:hypothetical protein